MTREQVFGVGSVLITALILWVVRSMWAFLKRVNRATLAINGDEKLGIPSIIDRFKTTDEQLKQVDKRVAKVEEVQERHVITHHPTINTGRGRVPRTQE